MTTTPTKNPPEMPDPRLPRHVQVRDALMKRLADRHWKAGEALPGESRLAEEFGISVGTMRKSIQALVQEGVLERIHGKGTFVTRALERASMLRFVRFQDGGSAELPTARILDIRKEAASPAVRQRLRIGPREAVLYLHRIRCEGDAVILAEHIWLPFARFGKLLRHLKKQSPTLLYPVYDAVCGVTVSRAIDELSVCPLMPADAKLFGVPAATMGVRIARTMHDIAGNVAEWRTSFVPADRFHYSVEIH